MSSLYIAWVGDRDCVLSFRGRILIDTRTQKDILELKLNHYHIWMGFTAQNMKESLEIKWKSFLQLIPTLWNQSWEWSESQQQSNNILSITSPDSCKWECGTGIIKILTHSHDLFPSAGTGTEIIEGNLQDFNFSIFFCTF